MSIVIDTTPDLENFKRLVAMEAALASGATVSRRDVWLFLQQRTVVYGGKTTEAYLTVGAVLVEETLYVSVEWLNASEEIKKAIELGFPHERLEVLIPKNWQPDNRATRRKAARLNRH